MNRFISKIALFLALNLVLSAANAGDNQGETMDNPPPNIIFIFADDLGYGDIGAFGATDINTPHIDGLAATGIKFTNFYAAANVCSPSRASLLTGRHSARMGISSVFQNNSPDGMPLDEITIAEMLKPQGYATALVGKWHLGHRETFMPWNQGFDEFYGVPYSNDMGNFFWYENKQLDTTPIVQRYLTQRYTDKAIDFIKRHQQQPFFLYLAHNMPHVPLYASENFEGSSERGLYGDVVQELDWSVGQIVASLKQQGLYDNTLIVFSSDNGPWLMMGDHGGSAGELKDGKTTTFEGGHRVPTVAHWPNGISPRQYDGVASMLDWFPTFAQLSGASISQDREIDGVSLSAVLAGDAQANQLPYVYFNKNNKAVEAIRVGKWKLKLAQESQMPAFIEAFVHVGEYSHPLMLIDLDNDPGESSNVAERYPEKVQALKQQLQQYRHLSQRETWLIMQGTSSDHKGYGRIKSIGLAAVTISLLLLLALLYGVYRLVKKLIQLKNK